MIKEAGGDADLEEMAKQELKDAKAEKEEYEEKLKILLLPKDPNDDKNIILEIRGAAGGDEAQLFAGDLLQMYQKYAESQGWRFEVLYWRWRDQRSRSHGLWAISLLETQVRIWCPPGTTGSCDRKPRSCPYFDCHSSGHARNRRSRVRH